MIHPSNDILTASILQFFSSYKSMTFASVVVSIAWSLLFIVLISHVHYMTILERHFFAFIDILRISLFYHLVHSFSSD